MLQVVTGVIDTVTASAPISIDGVTVTPGDSLATIQTNLRAGGGSDAEVYVTGESEAGTRVAGVVVDWTTSGYTGYNGTYLATGNYNSVPYFSNGTYLLYYNIDSYSPWSGWQLSGTLGLSRIGGSLACCSTLTNDDPSVMTGESNWQEAGGGGGISGTTTYNADQSSEPGSLNLTLLYPTAAGEVAPEVTGGTLTQVTALGAALAGAEGSQTTAGASGAGYYRVNFPPGVTPAAASATGTGAVPANPLAPGTVATPTVLQEGGASTAEVYNIVSASVSDGWVDSGALPEGVNPVQGVVARAHVLSVAGTEPTLVIAIQHADDDGAGAPDLTTLATIEIFAAFSTPGVVTIRDPATTLKRWRRCNYTIGGTNPEFVFCVAIATF